MALDAARSLGNRTLFVGILSVCAAATLATEARAQGAPAAPLEPQPTAPIPPATAPPGNAPPGTAPPGNAPPPNPVQQPSAPPPGMMPQPGPPVAQPGYPGAGGQPPPGYGYMPAWDPRFVDLWGPYGTAPYAPKTLSWEEGEPIPPGYQLESKFSRPLFITGAAMLGGGWLISSAMAAALEDSDFTPLVIPLVGPFITISSEKSEGAGTYVLILDGVVQTGGLVLLIAGLLVDLPYLERVGQGGVPQVAITPQGGALTWAF